MENRGLIITLIVLLSILILILVAFLCLNISGKIGFKHWNSKKSSQIIWDESYACAELEDLEILSTAGDIKFEESLDEQIRVVVYGEDAENLKVDFTENKLKVDDSRLKHKMFGFGFYCNDMTIYIPKNYAKNIQIKANYGDIEATDLENASFHIEEDCGDVSLGKVKNAFVRNHYGDIKIEAIGNQFEIHSDCGDVKINSITIVENSLINNSLGDIKVGQTNEVFIDAKTDLGDVKVNQNYRHAEITLKIENSCGDIKVEN